MQTIIKRKIYNKVRAVDNKDTRHEHSMDQSSSLTVIREWLIKYINQAFSVALKFQQAVGHGIE